MKRVLFLLLGLSFQIYAQDTWELLNPKPSAYSANDIWFTSDQHGYILNHYEILETTDAGATWNIKQNITPGGGVDFCFKDSSAFIVGNSGHILKSGDNGENWTQINANISDDLRSVDILNDNSIIISAPHKIIKSTDGGINWNIINISNITIIKAYFTSPLNGYAVCENNTIAKTTDGGLNWHTIMQTDFYDYPVIRFINDNTGFIARGGDIYKTTNGGETWTHNYNTVRIYNIYFKDNNFGILNGEMGKIYKTTNAGASWTPIQIPNTEGFSAVTTASYFINNNTGYATGAGGRIVKTTNGGQTWTTYSSLYNTIKQLSFTSLNKGYALTGNKYYTTDDSGYNWTLVNENPNENIRPKGFSFVNDNIGYQLIFNKVYKTTDGAQTWNQLHPDHAISNDELSSVLFLSEDIGYVTGGFNNYGIYKTINGGINWTKISTQNLNEIQFLTEDIGFGIHKSGGRGIYKTTDGGVTWSESFWIEYDEILSFHFVNQNVGYFVGTNGRCYKTSDGGNTWQQLYLDFADYYSVKFINEDVGYITGTGGLYRTIDGGENWEYQYNINSEVINIEFNNSEVYVTGYYGKILKGNLNNLQNRQFSTTGSTFTTIYPNPVIQYAQIESGSNIKSVALLDTTGRIIKETESKNLSKKLKIDIFGNSKGVYILKINFTNGMSESKKIIIK